MRRDPKLIHANMNMEDIIFMVLQSTRVIMHYKALIQEAVEVKKDLLADAEMNKEAASILTCINLDGRFIYYGKGLWGLRKWHNGKKSGTGVAASMDQPAGFLLASEEDANQDDSLLESPLSN